MFKITPIQDKTRQKEICDLCGAPFRPDTFAYQMYDIDSGEIMGMSQFEIGEVGYIYDLREASGRDDFEAMFILGRQTMNFIDLCNVHCCKAASDFAPERLILSLGFKRTEDEYTCDMTGMFVGHCGGHKVDI